MEKKLPFSTIFIFGFITDNTRSKIGRWIPYLRFTAPFLVLFFVMMWMTP